MNDTKMLKTIIRDTKHLVRPIGDNKSNPIESRVDTTPFLTEGEMGSRVTFGGWNSRSLQCGRARMPEIKLSYIGKDGRFYSTVEALDEANRRYRETAFLKKVRQPWEYIDTSEKTREQQMWRDALALGRRY